ncbi:MULTISPECIES: hypothetical protein [unclassified Sphingomonas]|uniref:hypothetical protein n=1 Tax=unclassified Sphingomonas TaxID=196159 RepID=UPI00215169AA|nr:MULTISPECIES: hypothetical protein [unclassified Sphingomonas]MCR5872381.1 hypothetical protein [Sphingomonas sp. J344]UUX99329.1 hypothetical protein LRS08_18025 [Sphingomonas sp. J315]
MLLGALALVAVAVPCVALYPYASTPRSADRPAIAPIVPPPLPTPVRVFARPLFATAEVEAGPPDAPVLTGIAGRLNRDAVALVRIADGSARTLKVGESVDGWRLESLAIDAAFFTRGRERIRVEIPEETPPAG